MDANALASSVQCPVCLDVFKQPKSLPCGHCFCKVCVDQVTEVVAGYAVCPVCREKSDVPPTGFPAAYALAAVVEQINSAAAETKYKCAECTANLPPSKLYVCSEDANKTFCGDCAIDGHKTHQLTKLTAAIDEYNKDKAAWLDETTRKVRLVEQYQDESSEALDRVARHCQQLREHDQVRHKGDRLLCQKIRAMLDEEMVAYRAQASSEVRQFSEPRRVSVRVQWVLDSHEQFSEERDELLQKAKDFDAALIPFLQPPPPTPPSPPLSKRSRVV